MKIAVVGMGKIGLPLAAQFASKGQEVIGVEVNPETVSRINHAVEPFLGEFGLAEALKTAVPSGFLRATASYEEAVPRADVVIVVVPLFVDENDQPDFNWMDSATTSIGETMTKNTLVIYETTLPIGTTRSRWKPMLEQLSGLKEGSDFHLVFSPERVLTGRVFEDLRKYPKLIGGLTTKGAKLAVDFYDAVLDFDERDDLSAPNGVWDLGTPEAAEMAKLAETTYRDVNIALANQFALHADELGVDIYKVIEACNSQPYSHIHRPGISVGGHCIPVYPRLYLSTDSRPGVVRAARELNAEMPSLMASRLRGAMDGLTDKIVLILGAAYRSGVKEDAFSGVHPLAAELKRLGANPQVIDPLYTNDEIAAMGLTPCLDFKKVAAIIVHTDHPEFRNLSIDLFPNTKCVVDGRNLLEGKNWPGVKLVPLGRP